MRAIILAAGRGSRMGHLTDSKPKCMTEVRGKPLIQHQLDALQGAGIKEIAIVTGYKSETLQKYGTRHFHNPRWAETNMVYSLTYAYEWLNESDCIVSYSDIFYGQKIIEDLIQIEDVIAISYDPNWLELWSKRFEDPLEDAETFRINEQGCLLDIGKKPKTVQEVQGQYMGLLKFGRGFFAKQTQSLSQEELDKIDMTSFLKHLLGQGVSIGTVSNTTPWGECDSESDVKTCS